MMRLSKVQVVVKLAIASAAVACGSALHDVRYVIHTITFCAVFGNEKVHFPAKKCVFQSKTALFSIVSKIWKFLERSKIEILKD